LHGPNCPDRQPPEELVAKAPGAAEETVRRETVEQRDHQFKREECRMHIKGWLRDRLRCNGSRVFRRPALGESMNENGGIHQVQEAMKLLLDQDQAKRYFLQTSADDRIIILPFNHDILAEWKVDGNQEDSLRSLLQKVEDMSAGGGTDIYSPVIKGIDEILRQDSDRYIPAIILMTDGESNTGKTFDDLKAATNNGRDIPIFAITFLFSSVI